MEFDCRGHGFCLHRLGMLGTYAQRRWHKLLWWGSNNPGERNVCRALSLLAVRLNLLHGVL